ncbi:MAG: substrate-binding domain-containing protein [Sphaerochaetaceae bacterium]|jgi:ribose transport system substrate-binding protein|nr:substrate-binding domain-containing protein [Sphaerochaetaceae bacterium]MDD3366514.1 substrate-binding domain-containing protein [Sphaerochaetaceae bacterium]MDD4219704.1 substrate-binding domain-containing protein [Sphaerochaetaceae bacterium]MDY0370823.1 substrate-binding domain-containing protein [Sphaerochaetaceae bacterium]
MKKILVLFMVLVVLTTGLFAAGVPEAKDDGKITIGMTVPGLQFPFFITMQDEALAYAGELGVELLTHDSQNQSSIQMAAVENFIAQKVDGILISPMTTDSLVPAIEAAVAAGIPVATVDRKANTDKVLIHVGADNVEGGRAAARFIIEQLGNKGTVIELEGTAGASAALDRKAGFDEVMKASNVKILVSQTADFSRSKAQNVMENLMQVYPKFDAVFGANDEMIIGAIEAMESAGINPASKITIGFDATTDAFAYMKEGKLDATIDQFPGQQASKALDVLVDFIKNGTKPSNAVVYINPLPVTE